MGAWGVGVFDDDVAADVRGVWEDAIDGGASPAEATARVVEAGADLRADPDDAQVFWIALAALQLDAAALDLEAAQHASSAIAANLERWREEADPGDAAAREKLLRELGARLASTEGRSSTKRAPKRRVRGRAGDVVQIHLADGTFAYGRLLHDASVAFYRRRSGKPGEPPIGDRDYAFVVGVYDDVVRGWPIVGHDPGRDQDDDWPPPECVKDSISGEYSIYYKGKVEPASEDECRGLEEVAAWGEYHVLRRLLGPPNT